MTVDPTPRIPDELSSLPVLRPANGPTSHRDLHLPPTGGAAPWQGLHRLPSRPDEFSFVLLSDRTGLARPGVFERAVDITNLLRPDFAIQIGDSIEGYTYDPDELSSQWAEFDRITGVLDVPLFRVPGNHDVSNEQMREEWLRRFGMLHYQFVYRDVLFIVLDTQDPPQQVEDFGNDEPSENGTRPDDETHVARLRQLQVNDPHAAVALTEQQTDWNGTSPANLSSTQLDWIEHVLATHQDVRWTVVCMHMPIWQGENPAFERLRAALADRPYTMFCGHVHNYRRTVIDGRDHIRLGPTGGLWVLSGDEGNFDHVTMVTMTPDGPRIANLVLDGVLGVEGGTYTPSPRFTPAFA